MRKLIKFKTPVPAGMTIYVHGVQVTVPPGKARAAIKFVNRKNRRVSLQYDGDKRVHKKAIKVIAISKGWILERRQCIGYLQDDAVSTFLHTGTDHELKAQLQLIAVESPDTIDIRLNLMGPKNHYRNFVNPLCRVT